ncbi:HD-GYP domain-containing protein (c-di-GMP phosphodiesterase class II) [Paenibacillus phyllosphaerae]|uniref:HD-GYP domain-containing protein (C-di-GMP phosphodiesterase class II) n=1 Tax=Paenibacillus phyllosphaerae TaxID=274593 RepID=A0A7W5AY66_9BACL|nr:HD-GYP domain-containing protein [Paenibacillus phyllosphaerae]MBB3110928.1 HD-GYP domain-containing protein (c-di-GMP phosphodiesterase class II) [Paenibacillus phyllosphaerae]
MATVAVTQVKLGDKLTEDALTPLGSVLFHKGKVITGRELDILQAFLVPTVTIESEAPAEEEEVKQSGSAIAKGELPAVQTGLTEQYGLTVKLLKRVYSQTMSGQLIPVLDLRNQMEALLAHIDDYRILNFSPLVVQDDDYIQHKSVMSAMSCYLLAQWVGLPKKDWMPVALAGLLHDIGNVKVDRAILEKPDSLTLSEVEEMRRHTVLGYQLLKNVAALNEGVKLASLQHHERVDGSGYPLGIMGDKIHPYAKIVAISDIFNAMTMKRVYRKAASPYLVLEQIQKDSFGKLEPAYVQIFIDKATQFHNGTIVRLSDDRIGEIVFSDRNHPTRPWVSVNGTIVNLTNERQLYIEEIMSRNDK